MEAKREIIYRLVKIFFTIMLIIGFGIIFYPAISDYVNSKNQSRALAQYEEGVQAMDPEEKATILAGADEYNGRILETEGALSRPEKVSGYEEALNPLGNGIMGIVKIDKIEVKLPIYHGTDEGVLQKNVGHLQGSSLPTGKPNTHAVITAHRGLPSARLFSDLDQMEVGDRFEIKVLDEVQVYQVYGIEVIEPREIEKLYIQEGRTLVTLMTCTPYGVNTHRMLIHGQRLELDQDQVQEEIDQVQDEGWNLLPRLKIWAIGLLFLVLFAYIIYQLVTIVRTWLRERRKE